MNKQLVGAIALGSLVATGLVGAATLNSSEPDTFADYLRDEGYTRVYDDPPETMGTFAANWCAQADENVGDDDKVVFTFARPMQLLSAADAESGEWSSVRLVTEAVNFVCPHHNDAVEEASRKVQAHQATQKTAAATKTDG